MAAGAKRTTNKISCQMCYDKHRACNHSLAGCAECKRLGVPCIYRVWAANGRPTTKGANPQAEMDKRVWARVAAHEQQPPETPEEEELVRLRKLVAAQKKEIEIETRIRKNTVSDLLVLEPYRRKYPMLEAVNKELLQEAVDKASELNTVKRQKLALEEENQKLKQQLQAATRTVFWDDDDCVCPSLLRNDPETPLPPVDDLSTLALHPMNVSFYTGLLQ